MERLLRPSSIAVVGGGAWCEAVIAQNRKIGFDGPVWHVHPSKDGTYASVTDLPGMPDAVFIGVNRDATIEVVGALAAMGAGGAVCFASGFEEAADGAERNAALLRAAGDMPILGPNCYGLINGVDSVALWPDQHGVVPVKSGVAIIAQSSNIAINLTMQQRGLPIAYVVTPGNQAQQGIARIAMQLLRDDRVTALGLYIESFGDVAAFEALAQLSAELDKPIVALKVGQSEAAQRATVTHTASLAGGAVGARLLLERLGIAAVTSLPVMLETLKLFHCFGRLPGTAIASLSCSGGEAGVMADTAARHDLTFPDLTAEQEAAMAPHLGPLVTLSNPLDYHTGIWRDQPAMTAVFAAMTGDDIDLTVIVLDFPDRAKCDDADWMIAVAAIEAAAKGGARFGVLASLGENMPADVAHRLLSAGIVPFSDFDHGCAAIKAAAVAGPVEGAPVLAAPDLPRTETLSEGNAKKLLSEAGLDVPRNVAGIPRAVLPAQAMAVGFPVALKAEGTAHKSEEGGVVLGLGDVMQVLEAAREMQAETFLIEEMIPGGVAELLVGVVADPAHGFVLTLGAGGVMTELMQDTQSLLIPATQDQILHALARLRIADLLRGYRGKPGAYIPAIMQAILRLQSFVVENASDLAEVEVNPLICTENRAVVADALIVRGRR